MIFNKIFYYVSIFAVTTGIFLHCSFAADTIPTGQSEIPAGQEAQQTGEDVFGEEGGRFHPFLLLEEKYIDNVFFTNTNEESDFITTIAPGIWLAVPANKEKLLEIGTSTTSPGGLAVSRLKPDANRRYQTYLLYSPEFIFFADNSQHDHTNHKLEGVFQYNFSSGLSLDFMDQYKIREEINDNGLTDTLYKFNDNIFSFLATYEPSEKFKFRFDYSNYMLDYDDAFNDYRDRTDNSFAFYIFYKIRPKTSIFAEYEFADIAYDTDSALDSVENRYFGGVAWEMTAKTRGQIKLGMTDKDFDDPALEDDSLFSVEVQVQHNLSEKKSLTLTGYRSFNESTLITASHFSITGLNAAYLHRFNTKWSGSINASYAQEKYEGLDRDDDVFGFGPAIRFKPKKWLIFDFGYQYAERDSSLEIYDYTANIFYLRANISM